LAARAVQHPFFTEAFSKGYQIRSIAIRAEPNQIAGETFWALDAMANTLRHISLRVGDKMVGNNSHLTRFVHNHYDPPQ
jgi:hypothetical protein